MVKLFFDYYPSEIQIGEPFNVAIILADEQGSPAEGVEEISVPVTLHGLPFHAACVTTVALGFGEALFNDLILTAYPEHVTRHGDEEVMVVLIATAEGYDDVECEVVLRGGVGASAATHIPDEELLDIKLLTHRLELAKGPNVKHYLMLIRGRMWARKENAQDILDCNLMAIVLKILKVCDGDEAIECIAVWQELLGNPSGHVLHSCASCRSTIRPQEEQVAGQQRVDILRTPTGLVFHSGCILCDYCKQSIGEALFIRDLNLKPFHENCAKEWGLEIREEPIRCTKLVLPSTENAAENFAPCLHFFLAQQAEEFIEVLQTKHLHDSFVLDRMKRCLVRVPKVVMNESAALMYLADKIGVKSSMKI